MRQLTKFQTTNLPARTLSYRYGDLNIFAIKGNHVFACQDFDYVQDATVEGIENDMSDLFTTTNHEAEFSVNPGQYGIGHTVAVYGEVSVPKAVLAALKKAQADLKVAEKKGKEADALLAEASKDKRTVRSNLEKFLADQAKNN